MEPTAPIGLPAESIDGHRVRLRRYREEDADDVRAACDDPVTQRFLPLLPTPYTREDALWWITEGSRAVFASGGGAYAVADPATDRLLGGIGLTHLREGAGEIGYWIAPWARRAGVATAAARWAGPAAGTTSSSGPAWPPTHRVRAPGCCPTYRVAS
jgi:RimJ/RimL family protein N-acetyltransferase